ncbi:MULTISPECIES: hypothetical protein [Enterobacteriaceae]|uniref:hypothetical protein n=1 Tax=Enterobacteriaceae TaxID=543 RepID=UPI000B959C1B|nr:MULTISPECIES: hypothetical protein [Enterobacteriaceae]OYI56198.1 hypothetical protein CI688_13060 [Shigella sonnei]HCN5210812.1 hypothetical protein [Escherichia coli]
MIYEKYTAHNMPIIKVNGSNWSVGFYLKPNAEIQVTGEKPCLNDFRDAFSISLFPLPAIDALYVATCVAFDENGRGNS